jgi:hypothetical protein
MWKHLRTCVRLATRLGLQNFGLCSALRVFEQLGIFIMPYVLWRGASVFLVSSEGRPHSVVVQSPPTTEEGIWRTYFNPDPYGSTAGVTRWRSLPAQRLYTSQQVRYNTDPSLAQRLYALCVTAGEARESLCTKTVRAAHRLNFEALHQQCWRIHKMVYLPNSRQSRMNE